MQSQKVGLNVWLICFACVFSESVTGIAVAIASNAHTDCSYMILFVLVALATLYMPHSLV